MKKLIILLTLFCVSIFTIFASSPNSNELIKTKAKKIEQIAQKFLEVKFKEISSDKFEDFLNFRTH